MKGTEMMDRSQGNGLVISSMLKVSVCHMIDGMFHLVCAILPIAYHLYYSYGPKMAALPEGILIILISSWGNGQSH